MIGNTGTNAPIASTISHNATVSNVISNMTLIHTGSGNDMSVAGIVHTGDLSGGSHFYNCKVGGIFNSYGSTKSWSGITQMNDFWQSGTDFIIKDCYVAPTCIDITVQDRNHVVMGNYVEGKSRIENCFYGGNIIDIIPVDEDGNTTNTQGISDENGLDSLYATGYWSDGNPTMPEAVVKTKAQDKRTVVYTEQEPVYDEETGEEIQQEPMQYPLLEKNVEAEGGTVWYQVNGGEWTTEAPTAAEPGLYTVIYKAVGDYLHRDSKTYTSTVTLVYDWATPANVTVKSFNLPYDDYGALTSGGNAVIHVGWDDHEGIDQCAVTAEVITPDGRRGTVFDSAPVAREYWYENGTERPEASFFIGVLGPDDEQTFENGRVNGIKYGDTIVITATGFVNVNGDALESVPGRGIDHAAGISNIGRTFPVLQDKISNDSQLKSNVVVKGDNVVVDCLASGGKAPYQYEVKYKKISDAKYSTAQSYSKNQIVSFRPGYAVEYMVHVDAKDSEGTVAGKDFTVMVNKVLANKSVISQNNVVLGESAVVTADAEGGIAPYEYEVTYSEEGSDNTVTAQDYNANQNVVITPDKSSLYNIHVNAKDSRGIVVGKGFTLTVNKPVENTSVLSDDVIIIGDTVVVNASARYGIGEYQYAVYYKKSTDTKWKTVSDYSGNSKISIKPASAVDYDIKVKVRDSKNMIATRTFVLKVNPPLKNTSVMPEDLIVLGDTATVTASAKDGIGDYLYKVSYRLAGGTEWSVISDYSEQASVSVRPETAGDYEISVKVKDTKGTEAETVFALRVNPVLTNISGISADLIVKGDTVTVHAAAEGGIGEYQYAVFYKKTSDTKWSTVSDYSNNTSVDIRPASAAEYDVVVKARDSRNVVARKAFVIKVNPVLKNTSKISSVLIAEGDPVTVNAMADGGVGAYQFAVSYRPSGNSEWTVVSDYSELAETTVVPDASGKYEILIQARDSRGIVAKKSFDITVNPALENTSVISAEEIVKGGSVTVNASAEGGIGDYQFAVYYKKASDTKWATASGYSTKTEVNIKPSSAAVYDVAVKVKDSRGVISEKTFSVKVNKILSNTSVISSQLIVKGGTVIVNASAEGGIGEYQYAVYFKKASDNKWATASDYSSRSEITIKPGSACDYDIAVKVKDTCGTIARKAFVVKVNPVLKNTSSISAEEIVKGETVTIYASAEGGIGEYTYSMKYKKSTDNTWATIGTEYSAQSEGVFRPAAAVSYSVMVNVKDSNGTICSKEFTLTVYPALKNKSTVSAAAITLGDEINVTAAAAGGKAGYTYSIKYKKSSDDTWTTIGTEYGNETAGSFRPDSITDYDVMADVRDSLGNIVSKEFKVTVYPVLRNRSSIAVDESVILTARATGGTGEYTYLMKYKRSSDDAWTNIEIDYADEPTGSFIPDNGEEYDVVISVTDSSGKTKLKQFRISITEEP